MSNSWIITAYTFARHRSLKCATKEFERLKAKNPRAVFEILRVKGTLEPSDASQTIKKLKAAINHVIPLIEANTTAAQILSKAVAEAEGGRNRK